jgi:hypothetical protein
LRGDGTGPGGKPVRDAIRCTAMSKQRKQRCLLPVVPGRKVCRFHGGHLGGRPPINGRYSQSLVKYREKYEKSLEDQRIWDLREHLAILDVAVKRSAARLETLDTPSFRLRLRDLYALVRSGTAADAARALNELGALIARGAEEDGAFEDFLRSTERLAKRLEKAWGIRLDAAEVINARDMTAVLVRFADIVNQEAGSDVAARVFARIDREVVAPGHGQPEEEPAGGALLELQEPADRIHEGGEGLRAMGEAAPDGAGPAE